MHEYLPFPVPGTHAGTRSTLLDLNLVLKFRNTAAVNLVLEYHDIYGPPSSGQVSPPHDVSC